MSTDAAAAGPAPSLIVLDDDPASGRLIGRIASTAGFAPRLTIDAGGFRAVYESSVPSVIVLDLQLGETDGIEQLRYLSAQRYGGDLVLVSGFDSRVLATARDLAVGLGLRPAATFGKPLDVEEFRQALRRLRAQSGPLDVERILLALREDEMTLDYQPVVSRQPRALRKLEALVRWRHPDLGRLAPDRFIPMVEANAAAVSALTEWVIGRAIRDYLDLQAQGVAVPIAVNVSPRNVLDLAFPDRIEQALRKAGMPAHQLCIEITESAALQDIGTALDILSRIRLKGMHLAIDDFGTGSSSLTLLRRMPFSAVKIDRSFIADMQASRDSQAIVKAIIDLTRNIELENIAEGVETEETAALLETLGVDMMQGYLFARPMPAADVPAWLDGWIGLAGAGGPAAVALLPDCAPDTAAPRKRPAAAGAAPAPLRPRLTPRQTEVMQLVSEGCSVKQIARRLDLGVGSVKTHLAQAYATLGAHNRVQALRQAGLLRPAAPEGAC